MEKHVHLMSIDMDYRSIYHRVKKLEEKENINVNEENLLKLLKEQLQEKIDNITLGD